MHNVSLAEHGLITRFRPTSLSIYRQYSFSMIPLLGQILASDRDSYQYLIESIEKFPPQPEFAQMYVQIESSSRRRYLSLTPRFSSYRIRNAGFQTGELREGEGGAWTDFTGGITSVHKGVKV